MDVGATKLICSLNLFALAFLMFSRICLHLQYAPIQLLVVPRTSELLKDIKVCNVHAKFFCVCHAYYLEQFLCFIALAGTCGKRMHVICRSSPVHLPCILFFSNVEH